ncbi:acyltransferase family protein [Emticicia sp. SJ17W-69]|uniref:acyltransferase family protein n=1 Tax=Emticicia sp. SJ17W-69 TaxID=3421657 RepID=UPI003EB72600
MIKKRHFGLDLFRAIAFFLVLITHSLFIVEKFNPKFRNFAFIGNLALEMFYALSGYLIGNIFFKNFIESDFSYKKVIEFLKNRWFKTLPTYYLIVCISLIVSYLQYGNFQDFSIKFLFFTQNLHEANFFFFPTSYTLAIEEWFYLSFPLLFWLFVTIFKWDKLNTFIFLSVFFILFSTIFRFYKYYSFPNLHWDTGFRKSILTRIDATAYGLLLSYFHKFKRDFIIKNTKKLFLIGVFGIICCILIKMKVHSFILYTLYFNLMHISITMILPTFFYLDVHQLRFKNIIHQISLISYCIYLVHLQLVYIPMGNLWQAKTLLEAIFQCFCMYFLAFMLGYLLYILVEKPMMKWRDKIKFV